MDITIGYSRQPASNAAAGGVTGHVGRSVVGVNVVEGADVVDVDVRDGCEGGSWMDAQPK